MRGDDTQQEEFCEGEVTSSSLLELIKSQGFKCALSGLPLTPTLAALDHKVPISKGGTHELSNLWWVHKDINAAKAQTNSAEFIAMCKLVATHNNTE